MRQRVSPVGRECWTGYCCCYELAGLLQAHLEKSSKMKVCIDCQTKIADGSYDLCTDCLKKLDDEIELNVKEWKKDD